MPLPDDTSNDLHESPYDSMTNPALQFNAIPANPAAQSTSGTLTGGTVPQAQQSGPAATVAPLPSQASLAPNPYENVSTPTASAKTPEEIQADQAKQKEKTDDLIKNGIQGAGQKIGQAQQKNQQLFTDLFSHSVTTQLPDAKLSPPSFQSLPSSQIQTPSMQMPQYQAPQMAPSTPQLLNQPGQLMSDRNAKTRIFNATPQVRSFLDDWAKVILGEE